MEKLTIKEKLLSQAGESFRKITANIEYANVDGDIKTIMMTSSLAGEGKTTIICNIATIMTESDKNILLIDLDLRKPAVHKLFNLSNQIGITDMLLKKDDYKNYIKNVYPKLDIITSGNIPQNPSKLIRSNAIKEIIKELSLHYDYVFIDTPPIIEVSDPITIASYSDAVIITICYSKTEIDIAKKAINSLKNVNANIIGTILNKVPVKKHDRYYYYQDYN